MDISVRLIYSGLRLQSIQRRSYNLHSKCKHFLKPNALSSQSAIKLSSEASREKIVHGVNVDSSKIDDIVNEEVLKRVNEQISKKSHSRLFAIIKMGSAFMKVTDEDMICRVGYFPANVGDKLRLEKVLAVGSKDFTILGRPLLSKDLVRIDATVIEKTLCVPRPLFRFIPRRRYSRLHWFRTPFNVIRINSITLLNRLDELPSVEGIEDRII